MTQPEMRAAIRLGRVLAAEGEALREGRYDRLDDLARRKAALVDTLAASAGGVDHLARLRPRLLRQQRLLRAALEGLRELRDALAQPPALRTYGPDGQPAPVAATAAKRVVRRV